MFEKKIVIKDDFMIVGKKKIMWEQIVGIREQSGPLLEKVSNRFPRAEIFLKGGKVITLSISDKINNESSYSSSDEKNAYELMIKLIRAKSANLTSIFDHWIEWRLIVAIVIMEIIALILCIILGMTFERIVIGIIMAGIIGAIIGWLWERQKRVTASSRHF